MLGINIGQAIIFPICLVGLLFYAHDEVFGSNYMEFTKREKIVSIGIGAIIIAIIVVLFNGLSAKEGEYSRILTSATYIDNQETFNYACNTSIGNSIISATFSTDEPVSDGKVQDCLYIKRDYEEYRQHTYTSTDSKGHTTVHTYWSWDHIKTDEFKSNNINIFDKTFDISNINLELRNLDNMGTDNFAYHKRYIYSGIKNNCQGILLTFIENNNLRDDITLIESKSIFYNNMNTKEAIIQQLKSELSLGKTATIIFFVLLGVGVIFFFGYAENDWLNR